MEQNSPCLSSLNDKSSLAPLIDEDLAYEPKPKTLDDRKVEINEQFGKLGHLPNLVAGQLSKMPPVLELLSSGNYNGEMSYADYHRPCNCTKSYCLKLYCECFARDKLCVNCNCNNCMNNLGHEKSRSTALLRILDKNPLAFLPKIGSGQGQKLHRKGCNCKRSECLKNYCECREAKIECSLLCRCQGCKNRPSELGMQMPQPPESMEMTGLDSGEYKPPVNTFHSHSELASDKPNGDGDASYARGPPYTPVFEQQQQPPQPHGYGAPLSDYFPHQTTLLPVSTDDDDYIKVSDTYKKITEEFWSQTGNVHNAANSVLAPSQAKQPRYHNWAPSQHHHRHTQSRPSYPSYHPQIHQPQSQFYGQIQQQQQQVPTVIDLASIKSSHSDNNAEVTSTNELDQSQPVSSNYDFMPDSSYRTPMTPQHLLPSLFVGPDCDQSGLPVGPQAPPPQPHFSPHSAAYFHRPGPQYAAPPSAFAAHFGASRTDLPLFPHHFGNTVYGPGFTEVDPSAYLNYNAACDNTEMSHKSTASGYPLHGCYVPDPYNILGP